MGPHRGADVFVFPCSTFWDIDGEAPSGRFPILVVHVSPRLSRHLNDLVKRDLVCSVACESQGGRVDSLDRAKSVIRSEQAILHNDMARVQRVPTKLM
jgi:hypothetical protein